MPENPAIAPEQEEVMKYLKMLGLAAVAAAALMAFAGAGTASADELCTTPAEGSDGPPVTTMCPAGKIITDIHATLVGSAKLKDTSNNTLDTCTSGTITIRNITGGTTTEKTPGESKKEDITWGSAGTNCTFTTTTIAGGTVNGTEAAGGGTTITAAGAEVTINTVLFGTCVYTVGPGLDLGSVAQGGNTLSINKAVTKVSGLCPSSSVWEATYKVTNHTAVYYINN